jgi:hypothetical protein
MADTNPAPTDAPGTAPTPSTPPRRKRRGLWWKIPVVLIALLVILVALTPTIASLSPVRNAVLSSVNKSALKGRVEVADWSFGWFSGQTLTGIKVYDADNELVATVPKVTVEQGIVGLTKGVTAKVDSPDFKVVTKPDGSLNVEHIARTDDASKSSGASKPKLDRPIEILNIPVRLEIVNGKGSLSAGPDEPTVTITNLNGLIHAPGGDAPIVNKLDLTATVGDGAPGTISVAGDVNVIKDGKLALDTASGKQVVTIKGIDPGSLVPLLGANSPITKLSGRADGTFNAVIEGGKTATLDGTLNVTGFLAAGPALKGDTYTSDVVAVSIPSTVVTVGADPTDVNAIHVKTGTSQDQPITLTLQQGKATVFADATVGSILKAIDGAAPGETGKVAVDANFDVGKLAGVLRNTFKLLEGAELTAGNFSSKSTIDITPESLSLVSNTALTGVAGTNVGKPVQLQPIKVDLAAKAGGGGNLLASVRDVKLDLSSAFANGSFSGPTLTGINGKLAGALDKVQAELGQVIDFGDTRMTGAFNVDVATKGDLTKTDTEPAELSAGLTVTGLKVDSLSLTSPIDQKLIKGALVARVLTDASSAPKSIEVTSATLRTGDEAAPTVSADATASVAMVGQAINVPTFEVKQFTIDLPKLGAEFGGFLPELRQATGTFSASLAGSAENVLSEPKLTLAKLSAGQSEGLFSASAVDGSPLVVSMPKSAKLPQVTGALKLDADLAKANAWVKKLTGGQQQVVATSSVGDVRSGTISGTVTFTRPATDRTAVGADFVTSNLMLSTSTGQADFKPLTLALTASAPDDLSGATIDTASVTGDLLTASATNAKIVLKDPAKPNEPVEPLKMIESADVALSIPNLAPMCSLAMAFMPATPAPSQGSKPAPQLQVAGGSFSTKANVSRGPGGLPLLNVPELKGENIVVAQGESTYQIASFTGAQTVAPNGDTLSPKGTINVSGLKVLDKGQQTFAEDQITIANDLTVDIAKSDAVINAFSIDMVTSKALSLTATGAVRDYAKTRKFDNVTADVTYDLAPLWLIAKPIVAADPKSTIATLQASGKVQKQWTVTGQLPADLPFNEGVKQLVVTGGVAVPLATLEGSKVENLDLPITVSNGVATISGQPAKFNDGTLDLSGITVDLTDAATPRLSIPPDKQLVSKATLNPFIADNFIGKFVNPVFKGATQAKGLIDLKSIKTDRIALDPDLLKSRDRTVSSGSAELLLNVTDLELGGGAVQLLQLADKSARGFKGEIKDGRIHYADGVVNSDITMQFHQNEKTYPLRFAGNVGLQNFNLSPMIVTLPTAIINKLNVSNELKKYLPPTIDVAFTGTTLAPQLNLNQMIPKLIQDASQKALTDNLLKGVTGSMDKDAAEAPKDGQQATPSSQPSDDPLGDLIKGLTKDKDKDKDKDKKKDGDKKKKKN